MPTILQPPPAPLHELKPYKSLEQRRAYRPASRPCGETLGPAAADPRPSLSAGRSDRAQSDLRGDSYQLSQMAADSRDCRVIVFCGVHFMAETADILANRPEKLAERNGERVPVVLPDMAAGCSMADMAGDRSGRRLPGTSSAK